MSDEFLIRHCAPTLAGIKTGNLFSYKYDSREEVTDSIRMLNKKLRGKGICVIPLKFTADRALIYVFRPKALGRDLAQEAAIEILRQFGYEASSPADCLKMLTERLEESEEFPHEIGLFLSYPPEDVAGFIENRAKNYKYIGTWKVYGDPDKARDTFAKYKKCSRVYYDQWKSGKPIEKLSVSC